MKRLTLKLAVVGVLSALAAPTTYAANPAPVTVQNNVPVTVTNPATNPVKTTDAYPRIPVRMTEDYLVPSGFRLVVETVSVAFICRPTNSVPQASVSIITRESSLFNISLNVARQGEAGQEVFFTAVQEMRVVVGPGERVNVISICIFDSETVSRHETISGYLISVDSPSLAP